MQAIRGIRELLGTMQTEHGALLRPDDQTKPNVEDLPDVAFERRWEQTTTAANKWAAKARAGGGASGASPSTIQEAADTGGYLSILGPRKQQERSKSPPVRKMQPGTDDGSPPGRWSGPGSPLGPVDVSKPRLRELFSAIDDVGSTSP